MRQGALLSAVERRRACGGGPSGSTRKQPDGAAVMPVLSPILSRSLCPSGSQRPPPPSTFCPPDPASHLSTTTTPLTYRHHHLHLSPNTATTLLFLVSLYRCCNRSVLVPPSHFFVIPFLPHGRLVRSCCLLSPASQPARTTRLIPAAYSHLARNIANTFTTPLPSPPASPSTILPLLSPASRHLAYPIAQSSLDSTRIPQLARLRHHQHHQASDSASVAFTTRVAYTPISRIRQQ